MATVLILLPLVSLYARQQIVGLMVIGALVALAAVRAGKPQPTNRWAGVDPWPAIAFLLFAAWGALSLTWSIDVGRSAGVLGKLVGIGLAGFVFALAARRSTAADRRLISTAALVAAAVSVAIIVFEAVLDLALIKWLWPMLGQKAPERLVYLNFPLLVMSGLVPLGALFAFVRGWWWLVPPLYAGALIAALQLESATSILSLLVTGIALPLFGATPRWFGGGAAALALIMGLMFIPMTGKPLSTFRPALETVERFGDSARHRLAIWGALSGKLGDRPVVGIGLGAIRSMPQAGKIIDVPGSTKSVRKLRVHLIPMHPHNAGLEIGLELGAVGLALALFMVLSILRTARNMATTRWQAAGIAALACAIAATSMMALSIWNYAYLSAWLIIFASLAGGSGRGSAPQPS